MRFLSIVVILMCFSGHALACEGFENAMGMLESKLKAEQSTAPQEQSLPHLQSLNKDLDVLEKAVRENRVSKAYRSLDGAENFEDGPASAKF